MSISLKRFPAGIAVFAAFVLVLSSVSPAFAQATAGTCTTPYTTVAGDSLKSIATTCGTTADMVFMDTQNQDLTLTAGQTVNAPTASSTTGSSASSGSTTTDTTASGSTTTGSTTTGTTDSQTGTGSTTTQVPVTGATNTMAAAPALASGQHYVVVFPGDTLSRYAMRYNTTIDNMLALNPQVTNRALIVDGQVLVVPDANMAAASTGSVPNTGSTTGTTGGTTAGSTTTGTTAGTTAGGTTDTTGGTTAGTTSGATATPASYTTVQGDTLMKVATAFNVTVAQLATANPDLTFDVGQTVNFAAASTGGTTTGTTAGSTTTGTTAGSTTTGTTAGSTTAGSTTGTTTGQVPVTGTNNLNFTGNDYYGAYFNQFTNLNSFSAFNFVPAENGTQTFNTFNSAWFTKPSTGSGQHVYQVKRGESVEFIANKLGISIESLVNMNRSRISWNGVLFTGQWINIP